MKNIETVQKIYEAFGKGDLPAILDCLDEQINWETWNDHYGQNAGVPWLQPKIGKEKVPEFFKTLSESLKISVFDVQNIMAGGNQVASVIFIEIESLQNGFKGTDEEMHLWTFNEEGKVIAFRHYCDTAKHIKAAGL